MQQNIHTQGTIDAILPKHTRVTTLEDRNFLTPEQDTRINPKPETGIKFDQDKLQFSLLPKGVLQPILRILGYGAKKYAAGNWQRVPNHRERYYNATQRHLTAWWEGEKTDPETGENHLGHAICCLLFLLWFDNKEVT